MQNKVKKYNNFTNTEQQSKYKHKSDKPIGSGDCSKIWLIHDQNKNLYVGKELTGPNNLCRLTFEPEYNALKKVNHPNCVKMVDK